MTLRTIIHALPDAVPAELRDVLRNYRKSVLAWGGVGHAGMAVVSVGLFVLAACAFDRCVDVPGAWRAPLPWVGLALLVANALLALFRLARRPDYDRVAHALDGASQDRRDHLRTIVQFSRAEGLHAFFTNAAQRAAVERWKDRRAQSYVDRASALRWAGGALALLTVYIVLACVPAVRVPLLLQRFLNPRGNYMRPTATWFDIAPMPAGPLLSGDDLTIRARLAGRAVKDPAPIARIRHPDGSTVIRALEPTPEGLWQLELRNLQADLAWTLVMGPARSARNDVRVLPRPTAAQIEVTYNFPNYSRRPPAKEILRDRRIVALAGTKLKLRFLCNVPVSAVTGVTEDDSYRFRVSRADPREAVLHFILNKNQKMALQLVSTNGVESKHELPLTFSAIQDAPPSVSILNDIDGKSFYVTDTLEIRYRAQDDLGLSGISLKTAGPHRRYDDGPITVDLDLPEFGATTAEGRALVPVADLVRGDERFLQIKLLAIDTKDQEGPSQTVTIKVAADSFDRQLRRTLKAYTGAPNSPHEDRGMNALAIHSNRLNALKGVRNNLTIMADSLAENTPPGDAQRNQLAQIRTDLAALAPAMQYGSYWFFDHQNAYLLPRFRALAEYANIGSVFGVPIAPLTAAVEAALKAPNPKAALQAVAPACDVAIAAQEKIAARVNQDCVLIRRELAGYLLATFQRQVTLGEDAPWHDRSFAVGLHGMLDEARRLGGESLRDDISAADLDAIAYVATNVATREALTAVEPVVARVRDRLAEAAAAAITNRWAARELDTAGLILSRPPEQEFRHILGCQLYQETDNFDVDDLFVFEEAMRYLHLVAGAPDPYRPVENPDPAVRAREHADFVLLSALQRARMRLQQLRLGVASDALPAGRPEREDAWMLARESRFELLTRALEAPGPDAELNAGVHALTDRMGFLAAWLPPTDLNEPARLQELDDMEAQCLRLAARVQPTLAGLFSALDRAVVEREPLLRPAIAALRARIEKEIARIEATKDGQGFGDLHAIKIELISIVACAQKLLDAAELARLYGGTGSADIPRLTAMFVSASQLVPHFEAKVEGLAWIHRTGGERLMLEQGTFWVGKISSYRALIEKLDALDKVSAYGRTGAEGDAARAAVDTLQAAHGIETECDAIQAALRLPERLTNATAYVAGELDVEESRPALFAEVFYAVHRMVQDLARPDAAPHVQRRAAELQKVLPGLGELPRELHDLPQFAADSTAVTATGTPATEDLAGAGAALDKELGSPLRQTKRISLPTPSAPSTWVFTIDESMLTRAKLRSMERMAADSLNVKRAMAALALGLPQADAGALTAARVEAELDRRKAGLTLSRTGLGAMALGDAGMQVNLPPHIYLELKRARESAMPPLFRDRCYEYLNSIVEQARK